MATTHDAKQAMTILVGYDGSDCAAEAIKDLSRAGLPEAGAAVVVALANSTTIPVAAYSPAVASVGDFTWATPAVWQELVDDAKKDAERTADAGAALLKSVLPGWDVSISHDIDSPYRALIEEAQARQADLIVVGTHGRSALGRLALGSTSQFVLTHAHCSVRVARHSETAPGLPLRLLVCVDGSAGSYAAAREVARRHWPAGTEARLLAAVDLQLAAVLRRSHHADRKRSMTTPTAVIEIASQELRGSSLIITPVVEQGDPKQVIVDEAARWGADSIFLGATGHGRLERFLLGSVSAAVAARASCSVEVVRVISNPSGGRPASFASR